MFQENLQQNMLPKMTRRKSFGFRFIFLLAFLSVIFAAFFWIAQVFLPLSLEEQIQNFKVAKGESAYQIAANLKTNKIIASSRIFYSYARLLGYADKLQAGEYALSPTMSIKNIVSKLAAGDAAKNEITVRIVEGQTLDDIGNIWAAAHPEDKSAKTSFLNSAENVAVTYDYFGEQVGTRSLEGYLFPDTYFVARNAAPDTLIKKMLANLEIKLSADLLAEIRRQNKTVRDVLTLASIVEKEVGRGAGQLSQRDLDNLTAERKIVAGIFYNRLENNIALQSDATVTYLTKKKDPSPEYKDLEINSPYNTYKNRGLPPGPISNPSLSAIIAAIRPISTDYLYFLTKPDGTPVFAKTYAQHLANKQKYLK